MIAILITMAITMLLCVFVLMCLETRVDEELFKETYDKEDMHSKEDE